MKFYLFNLEFMLLANCVLELLAQRQVELYNFATAQAYQMLMFCGWFSLIMMVFFNKMIFSYQSQLLEKLQVAINSGQTQPVVLLICLSEEFVSIKMPIIFADKVKQERSLIGHPLT